MATKKPVTPPKKSTPAAAKPPAPKRSATYGQVTGYAPVKSGTPAKGGAAGLKKAVKPVASFTFHDQQFTQGANGTYTRANGKAVGKKGTSLLNAAVKKRGAGANATQAAPAAPAAAGTAGGSPPVFNPAGNLSWNGATGLSQDAVNWLSAGADSSYLDDVNGAQRAYDTMKNDLGVQRTSGRIDRLDALKRLGYNYNDTAKTGAWADTDLTTQRGQALSDMGYDYGARGILHSTEYARKLVDTQNQFQDQANAIITAGTRFDDSLTAQDTAAQGELSDARLAAIRNAVQRRAASAGALT